MPKQRILPIDLARGIAIIAVLLIHVTSQAIVELPTRSHYYMLYLFINKVSSFSVPTFLFMSGLVLFYGHFDSWKFENIIPFYRNRLIYVILPYIIWSAFYYVLNYLILNTDNHSLSFSNFLLMLLNGSASYHLYFVVLITQFYILFPLILLLVQKIQTLKPTWSFYILVSIGVFVQFILGLLYSRYHWVPDKSILCTTYFLSFCLGGYVGSNYQLSTRWIQTHFINLLSFTLVFLFCHLCLNMLDVNGIAITHFIKELVVQIYCILSAVLLLEICRRTLRFKRISKIIGMYGTYSFGIYLVHPALLSFMNKYILIQHPSVIYHFEKLLSLIIALLLPILIVIYLKKWRFSWLILGK